MKRIQFWSLLLGLTFGALALTACGGDDDDSTPSDTNPPTLESTVVGYWKGYIPANNTEDMAMRYAHYLYYYFGNDNKFWLVTSFFQPTISKEEADRIIQNALDNGKTTTSVDFNGEVVYIAGTYSIQGSQVALNATETATYDSYYHKWFKTVYRTSEELWGTMKMAYQFGVGTLTLSSDDSNITHFAYHHTLVGRLDRVSSITIPDVPDPDPIIGDWTKDDTSETLTVKRSFDQHGGCSTAESKIEGGQGYVSGKFVSWDRLETVDNGTYTLDNGKVTIVYTYRTTNYYANDRRVEVTMYNYDRNNLPTETLDYTINGDKMTIGEDTYTRQQ